MKFFVVIVALTTIALEVREATSDDYSIDADTIAAEDGYNYFLVDATRWLRTGEITYRQRMDSNNSISASGEIWRETARVQEYDGHSVDVCTHTSDGTWDDVIAGIVLQTFVPNGQCPVDPGTYVIKDDDRFFANVSVSLKDKVPCGRYTLNLAITESLYDTVIVQVQYETYMIDLDDKDNC